MSSLYFDILTEDQKKTLESLKSFSKYGFLAGGTALALQLAHRRSYDFDIFCTKPVPKGFLLMVKKHFKKVQILVDTPDELSFISPLSVKISFVFYPFNPVYKTISISALRIFNWKEIALDKAYAIGRRGEWRDYIDLYFIIKTGFPLKSVIRVTKRKFGDIFSGKLFLSQLCYFRDIKDFSIEFIKEEIAPPELQKFFEREIKKLKLIR